MKSLLILVLLLSTACAYALNPPQTVRGQRLDANSLDSLTRGMAREQVEKLLGVPTRRGDRVWVYEWVHQRRGDTVLLLGLIPVRRPQKERCSVRLEFGPAGLLQAEYLEQSPERSTSRALVER